MYFSWRVPVEYRYLETADYTVAGVPLFIVRHRAKDFVAALRHWPASIAQEHEELRQLEASGASCLVVLEGDADSVVRDLGAGDSALQGDSQLLLNHDFGIPWLIASSHRNAELAAFEVMWRAWQRAHVK